MEEFNLNLSTPSLDFHQSLLILNYNMILPFTYIDLLISSIETINKLNAVRINIYLFINVKIEHI